MGDFRDCVNDLLEVATCVFGEDVRYFPKRGGGGFKIRGIFDTPFEQVDPDTEAVVASNSVSLGVKLKDLPFPPEKGDKILIREVAYRVIDSQEDGQGGAELFLHRAA